MKKHTTLLSLLLLVYLSAFAQFEYVSGTLKNGSKPNSVIVVLKSNTTFTSSFTNLQFMVQIPSSIKPQPQVSILNNPIASFINGNYTTQIVEESGYYNYLFNIINVGGAPFKFNAGVDYEALEIQFSGSNKGTYSEVRLSHLPDGGSTSQLAFYIEMGSDYTNYTNMFYGINAKNGGNYSSYSYVPIYNIALPFSFIEFSVVYSGKNVNLNWQIKNEYKKIISFDIERSIDGIEFKKIGTNFKNNNNLYNYTDNNILEIISNKVIFYRIKTYYEDNNVEFSNIQKINQSIVINPIYIYPNPTFNKINILYKAKDVGFKTLKLVDIQGETVLIKTFNTQIGNNNISIDVSILKNGTYLIVGLSENGNIIIKQ
jgi:hypothetical protein